MTDLLIRSVPEGVVARLKEQARANSRSLQGELTAALEFAVKPTLAEWLQCADEIRARMVPNPSSDSTDIVRQNRDSC